MPFILLPKGGEPARHYQCVTPERARECDLRRVAKTFGPDYIECGNERPLSKVSHGDRRAALNRPAV